MPRYEGIASCVVGNGDHVVHGGRTYLDAGGFALVSLLVEALVY